MGPFFARASLGQRRTDAGQAARETGSPGGIRVSRAVTRVRAGLHLRGVRVRQDPSGVGTNLARPKVGAGRGSVDDTFGSILNNAGDRPLRGPGPVTAVSVRLPHSRRASRRGRPRLASVGWPDPSRRPSQGVLHQSTAHNIQRRDGTSQFMPTVVVSQRRRE